LEFSAGPVLHGCQLSWGRPGLSANSLRGRHEFAADSSSVGGRPVYLLFGRDGAGQWYEVNQTEATQTRIAVQTLAKLDELLLVAVGRHGVLTSAQLLVDPFSVAACGRPASLFPADGQRPRLVLESMVSDGMLYRAVVRWSAPVKTDAASSGAARYLVRWRTVPEGFAAGSLLTNGTSATLALLPDSHVQVEVSPLLAVDEGALAAGQHPDLVTGSLPLLISTFSHTAAALGTPSAKEVAALAVALASLALSILAFLAMAIRVYLSRRQAKLTAVPLSDPARSTCSNNTDSSVNNNSNCDANSNVISSKKLNENTVLSPAFPNVAPSIFLTKSSKEFKFPVNEINFNSKEQNQLTSLSKEQNQLTGLSKEQNRLTGLNKEQNLLSLPV
jgi:hypothetical protein